MVTHRRIGIKMLIMFKFWVWKTNLKELYYKFFSVPEWRLENIQHAVDLYIDDYVESEKNDCHEGYSDFVLERLKEERISNGMSEEEAAIPRSRIEVVPGTAYLPHAHFDSLLDEANYIGSAGIGEIEVDLQHCQEYCDMSPSEHEAYMKWCEENHYDQPSDIHCVYANEPLAFIHVYLTPERSHAEILADHHLHCVLRDRG